MTSKEYFDEYDQQLYDPENDCVAICYEIFARMANEMNAELKASDDESNELFLKKVTEYNGKWNELVNMFLNAHSGMSILRPDGFAIMVHKILRDNPDEVKSIAEGYGC